MTKKIILSTVFSVLFVVNSFAFVIGPNETNYITEGTTVEYDSLVVSGMLVFANHYGTKSTGGKMTIIITNGDFVVAGDGIITQIFDYGITNLDGNDGADGYSWSPSNRDGGNGENGIGYGIGGKGITALLSMLQSCSLGLLVVNVDDGIGAGVAAATIANRVAKFRKK